MIEEPNVYQMKPGKYVEDTNVEALAGEYFGDDPIIDEYEARVYETEGDKKNHLYFQYDFIDLDTMVQEYEPEEHEATNENINRFLEEVTGRTAKNRRDDLKKQS